MKKLIFALMLCSQIVLADCKPVTYLAKGSTTTCSGYLFTEEKELEVRTKVLDYERLTRLSANQDELINILDERLGNQIVINDNLRANLEFEEKKSVWVKALYFGLGVVATGLVVYSAKQVK